MKIIDDIKRKAREKRARKILGEIAAGGKSPVSIWQSSKHKFWGDSIRCTNHYSFNGHTSPKPKDGDYIIQSMASGEHGIYLIVKMDYCDDPADMWFAKTEPLGYITEFGLEESMEIMVGHDLERTHPMFLQ